MAHYYIIDKRRSLHISEGATREKAVDRYNDSARSKADHAILAIPCVHPKKFLPPDLPEWMDDIQITIYSCLCYKCGETQKEPAIAEDEFYQSKNEL